MIKTYAVFLRFKPHDLKPILPYQQTNDYNTSFAINRRNVIEGACSF